MSPRFRQLHRVMAVLFTLAFLANIACYATGNVPPPEWVTYAPLFPLFVLFGTGLWLLVLPWLRRPPT